MHAPDCVASAKANPLRNRAVLLLGLGQLLLGSECLVALENHLLVSDPVGPQDSSTSLRLSFPFDASQLAETAEIQQEGRANPGIAPPKTFLFVKCARGGATYRHRIDLAYRVW